MKSKVEIRITEGVNDDGTGGTVSVHNEAVIPASTWEDVKDAATLETGWTPKVENPDFDPSVEESESNPRQIDNPVTKAWNVTQAWRHRMTILIKNLKKRQGVSQVESQVETGVSDANKVIDVIDKLNN